jgi:hypothetical protein
MFRPTPRLLQPSPTARSVAAVAALLASFAALGTIDAMALHYSTRQQHASPLVGAADALHCGTPHSISSVSKAT